MKNIKQQLSATASRGNTTDYIRIIFSSFCLFIRKHFVSLQNNNRHYYNDHYHL
jgi:hypothetical protein